MGSMMIFTPEQAWQTALRQVQLEMPRASFDTWIRPVRLLSFEDGVFRIGCINTHGRDWLESRLTVILERILSALLMQDAAVRFIVIEEGVPKDEERNEKFELNDADGAQLETSVLHDSLRDILLEPNRVVRIPVYFLRWLPYVGARTVFLAAALWQMQYLTSGGEVSTTNPRLSARAEQICQWAGISRAQFFRCLEPGGSLGWFARKSETDYEIDRRSGRVKKSANKYLLYHLPLTPGDAEDLKVYLLTNGICEDTLSALQLALEADPCQILCYPVRTPPEGFADLTPRHLSVQQVVRKLLGKPLDSDLSVLVDRLADRLRGSSDFMLVSWYFLRNWLPLLGHDASMWVLALRKLCYFNDATGELRDEGWIEGGYDAIAERLGLHNPRLVASWFPAAIERGYHKDALTERSQAELERRKRFQELLGLFVQRVDYRANASGSFDWKFKVARSDPLTPEHTRIWQAASTLLTRVEDAGLLETLFDWVEGAAPEDLAACAVRGGGNACLETHGKGSSLDLRPTQAVTACPETLNGLLKACLETLAREANTCFETLLKLLKIIKDSKIYKDTYPDQDTTPEPDYAVDEKAVAGVIAADGSWSLEKLLRRVSPNNRQALLSQESSALPFVSWVLHGTSQEHIKNPYNLAIAKLKQNPGISPGGSSLRLTQMPPRKLVGCIAQQLSHRSPADPDWRLLFSQVLYERILLLVDALGLELNEIEDPWPSG
jgi:hypothetical protein